MTGTILLALISASLVGCVATAAAVALFRHDELRRMAAERAAVNQLWRELDELVAMHPADLAEESMPLRQHQLYAFELAVLVTTIRGHLRPDWRTT